MYHHQRNAQLRSRNYWNRQYFRDQITGAGKAAGKETGKKSHSDAELQVGWRSS